MSNHLISFSATNRGTYTSTKPNFICIFALVFLLASYIGLSNAAPTLDTTENSTQKNTNTSATEKWAKGRLLITPRAGLSMKEMEKALNPHGAKSKRHHKKLNLHILELPTGMDEAKVMHTLKRDRRFKNVELDMLVAPDLTVTDPAFGNSWALPKIDAPTAWDIANGDGVTIAILDTGVNSSHPDLAANMVPGWNVYDNNANTADVFGHGTKVAGSAAAAANNGTGSTGVSWNSNIMPIRISKPDGYAYFSDMAEGIRWAADNGAKVANLSYGGAAGSSTVQSAANYMRSKGGIVVISAGNTGGSLNYVPSNAVLVASATGSSDTRPSWSSYGPFVDVSAPGVSIYTTTHTGGYSYVSGTSFSSPIVAATVALMYSANDELSPADIDQIIKSTAVDLGATGFDNYYGAGRINTAAAVAAASVLISTDEQAPSIAITSPMGGEISGIVPIDVNYADNVGVVRVELHVNGLKTITDTQAPFAFSWDTTTWADDDYLITAVAFDAAGNETTSPIVTVTVNNSTTDTQAPTLAITAPTGGEVSDTVTVNVNATDNVGVTRVEFFLNGQIIMTDTSAPFTASWNTTTFADGNYILSAKAFDAADNAKTSSLVYVTVNNALLPIDTIAPVISHFNLTDGMRVSRKQSVTVSATDDQSVAQISLTINGKVVAVSQSSSMNHLWNTRAKRGSKNAMHTVSVKVSDQAGNITSKTVTVFN